MSLSKPNYKSRIAFTLAEVLITLLIIGIVASLVIPALIHDTQDAEFRTAWKKSYSDLSQATAKIMMDNGGTLKGSFSNAIVFRDKYLDYLTYTKKCDSGLGTCWHYNGKFKYLGGADASWNNRPSAILNNGNYIFFETSTNSLTCASQVGATTLYRCGWIAMDINGNKAPNTVGLDIFMVNVQENKITPFGIDGDDPGYTCSTTNSHWGSGYSCSAKYLYQ